MTLYDDVYGALAAADVRFVVGGGIAVVPFYDPERVAREVDMFVAYPLDFERLVASAVPTRIGEYTVRVAAIGDLLEMKRAAGRPQDLADIDALERLRDRGRGG
ncbi:MAG: hypothetical protein ACT4QG_02005 [Sporichthyaceae bacterium]